MEHSATGRARFGTIDPIRIQGFNDQKVKKKLQLKKINFFWINNYNLPIPGPP
jgi:hypothetical protein